MVSASDVDRLFLQAVLSRGVMSSKLAQLLWEKSIEAVNSSNDDLKLKYSNDKQSWDAFVAKINRSLDKLQLEFRALHDELTGKEMYAIVNRKDDEIAQMATDYTPAEITFFKAVVEQIILAPHEAYSVSSIAALRELTAAKITITKAQAEVVLASFVAKGWLLKSKRGRYSLSTRALLELIPYLKSSYPDDIIECTICMDILTRGIACFTPNCTVRMHLHCFNTFRKRNNGCPSCGNDWPRDVRDKKLVPVGEEAAKEGDDRRRHVRLAEGEGSDEEEEEEPLTQDSPPKKAARGKGKQRAAEREDSMDAEDDDESQSTQPTQSTQRTRRSTRR
ncbi:hypothetical protein HYPSUDRAFT_130943 [Hypholoma sublateritium FD-334 SS-4]|uniref:Non-structural maintenance of chromosomes element 1 homolog n=1 Tax=Hypholoma sublateritium (strain FD-334 SS-4) TaxID=945553 RepID=A0A0D2LIP9_HYPSF|nr:hypothetical protein HYPSUDRAFT_130943 [Hypholoma sublateritium FD-334 SS-4]